MTKLRLVLSLALLTLLGSCVPSIHPLYGDDDLRFDPALLGTWQSNDGDGDLWTFAKRSDGKAYSLTVTESSGEKHRMLAHLVEAKGLRFLDLYPEDSDGPALFIPTHAFLRVRGIEPTLTMQGLDPDWLDGLLDKNPYAIAHERTADGVILTAPTKALQAFLKKHDHNEKAWSDFEAMRRLRDENPVAR